MANGDEPVKIVSIDVIQLKEIVWAAMWPVIVRVNTDEGIYGLGEIGVAIVSGAAGAFEVIRDFAPMLLGMDPMDTEVIWEMLHKQTFWTIGNGGVIMSAVSAIDTALWDLKGKALGLPLYKLLGGKQRKNLRAYASQLQFGWNTGRMEPQIKPEQFAEMGRRAVEEGFDAIKVNIISRDKNGRPVSAKEASGLLERDFLRTAEQRLKAMREAVGPEVDIILENHAETDAVSAVRLAHMAEPYDILFMEEAASPMCPESFKRIADRTSIPLATGERTYTRWGFRPLIDSGALSVIQPDIGNCGGISEFKKISDYAQMHDVHVQAHVCSSPISVAAALQAEAALPNFAIHEHHITNTCPEVTELCVYDYQPRGGFFEIPELPGIGQDLSEKALREARIITVC